MFKNVRSALFLFAFFLLLSVSADQGFIGVSYKIQQGFPLVVSVNPGYPAAKAGIKAGDWIMSIDGYSLQNLSLNAVSGRIGGRVNQTSTLVISRNGQRYTVSVTRVPPPLATQTSMPSSTRGIFGINYTISGGYPLINKVTPGYPADLAKIRSGDWIVAVDGRSTQGLNLSQVSSLLQGPPGRASNLTINRNGKNTLIRMTRAAYTSTPQLPTVQKGYFGFNFTMQSGFPLIKSVTPGYPAARAGLKAGDWLMSVDGKSLKGQTYNSASSMMAGRPGQTSSFIISRNGRQYTLSMTRAKLAAATQQPPVLPALPTGGTAYPKAPVTIYPKPTPTPKTTYPTYSADPRPGTVGLKYEMGKFYPVIKSVLNKQPAKLAGLRAGDRIIYLDGQHMYGKKRKQVASMLKGRAGQVSLFTVKRNGNQYQFKVKRVPKK